MTDATSQRVLQPPAWPRPRGYANGIVADGKTVFLAGQVGWDARGHFVDGLVGQIDQALTNIVTLLTEAGAETRHLVRLTWYLTDLAAYRENQMAIGTAYRRIIGKHFPTMSAIGVVQLVEPAALVEIEATAVLPTWHTQSGTREKLDT
jgi:enamine deaminase RidA (YjgF/YER057c/UK114 family)